MSDYLFWEHFENNIIRDVVGSFVEFSAKLSNSNAKGGVSVMRHVDLPYLAVSTIAPGMVEPMGAVAANYAKSPKQVLAVKSGMIEQYGMETSEMRERIEFLSKAEEGETGKLTQNRKAKIIGIVQAEFAKVAVPDDEILRVREIINGSEKSSAGDISLDRRLKQLLVFDPELNADISVTPLRSSGLPELVIKAERHRAAMLGNLTDDEYELLRFTKQPAVEKKLMVKKSETGIDSHLYRNLFSRCEFPIGGGNPVNAGIGKASAIRSPLLVSIPSVNKEMSKLFAIHNKGIEPVRYEIAAELLADLHQENFVGHDFDVYFKKKLTTHARRLVSDMNHRARIAMEQLRAISEDIAGKSMEECSDEDLLDEELLKDKIQAGIFLPCRRDNEWRKAYADIVINYLMVIKFKPKGESELVKSKFSDNEADIIRSTIEKETI